MVTLIRGVGNRVAQRASVAGGKRATVRAAPAGTTGMKPYTAAHLRYHDSIADPAKVVTVGVGAAGCGKTYVACSAAVRMLMSKQVSKVVVTRPAVCAGEEHGFLPGDLHGKMRPYVQPIYDSMLDFVTKQQLDKFMENEQLEVAPLAYMRGRTFSRALVIADEAQNMSVAQMKMLLTRVGAGSSLVITGDPSQSDLGRGGGPDGLSDFLERLELAGCGVGATGSGLVEVVRFDASDMLRNDAITELLELYAS